MQSYNTAYTLLDALVFTSRKNLTLPTHDTYQTGEHFEADLVWQATVDKSTFPCTVVTMNEDIVVIICYKLHQQSSSN